MYVCVCMYECVYVCMYESEVLGCCVLGGVWLVVACVCVRVFMCVCVCMYVCMIQ
jgi:hypothetical protein